MVVRQKDGGAVGLGGLQQPAAIWPPAPGRFSTSTLRPSSFSSRRQQARLRPCRRRPESPPARGSAVRSRPAEAAATDGAGEQGGGEAAVLVMAGSPRSSSRAGAKPAILMKGGPAGKRASRPRNVSAGSRSISWQRRRARPAAPTSAIAVDVGGAGKAGGAGRGSSAGSASLALLPLPSRAKSRAAASWRSRLTGAPAGVSAPASWPFDLAAVHASAARRPKARHQILAIGAFERQG